MLTVRPVSVVIPLLSQFNFPASHYRDYRAGVWNCSRGKAPATARFGINPLPQKAAPGRSRWYSDLSYYRPLRVNATEDNVLALKRNRIMCCCESSQVKPLPNSRAKYPTAPCSCHSTLHRCGPVPKTQYSIERYLVTPEMFRILSIVPCDRREIATIKVPFNC